MLKILSVIISLFLILIIFFQLPADDVGLSSFASKSTLLGSPNSAQRILKIVTIIGILSYMIIALQLNIRNH